MAMIKCPECGQEISERAKECPNCGYPLKKIRKMEEKKQPQYIECRECGKAVSAENTVCPYCGNPLMSQTKKVSHNVKKFFSVKRNILVTAILGCVFVIGAIGLMMLNKNIFDDYTKYLGKNAKELPRTMTHEQAIADSDYYQATPDSDIMVFDVNGEMVYGYSKSEDVENKAKKNEITQIGWHSEDDEYSQEDVDDFLEKMEKIYGKYDKKENSEIEFSGAYPYPRRVTYEWDDKNGVDVSFFVNEKYDLDNLEDFDYEDEDKIVSYGSMHIWWSEAK